MKILIIDRDQDTSQLMTSSLEPDGHEVVTEFVKNEGLECIAKEHFDLIFIDPYPMKDARAMALNIRRSAQRAPYIILMTAEEEINSAMAMQMGCNEYITKPVQADAVREKIKNVRRLNNLFNNLGDTSEDFPSAGGVIAKSAFNQLCLSAMERGGRYNELAFILTVSIENFTEMKALDGAYVADYAVSKMAHHMVRLRRQSDIIGQTGVDEYSILLQRTQNLSEAIDAAKRFATAFDEIEDILPDAGNELTIEINLMHLPTGDCPFHYSLSKKVATP